MKIHLRASIALLGLLLTPQICAQDERRPILKVYPDKQAVNQDGDAVFDCRDEGPLRVQVQWLRGKHLQESHRGRLILRQVQAQHAGTYTCRTVGGSRSRAGAEVKASLQVLLHGARMTALTPVTPRLRRPHQMCTSMEAQCRNGECVPKEFVCDGEFDCTDGSDELHCQSSPSTLPPTKPRVAELRATVACGKDEGPCRNRQCIPIKFFCDGEFDCTDGSDEIHCNMTSAGKHSASSLHRRTLENNDEDSANELDTLFASSWDGWSAWGPCDERCEQVRNRKCKMFEGNPCDGPATDRRKCQLKDCQVDGGWSGWTAWTSCSVSCGRGTRRRYRKCNSPAPNYGGAYCLGSDGQQQNCVQAFCATEGHWGSWGQWTPCSRTNNVTRVRRRLCKGGTPDCQGVGVEEAPCHPCPRSLKIGMRPVHITVSRGRLVNFTCHYRQRGQEPLTLELDLPSIPHSNEVIKSAPDHRIISDSLTATRCGTRRRWTLLLGGGRSLVRCVVRDSQGQVLGKAESKVISVPPPSSPCQGDKNCPEVRRAKKGKTFKKELPKLPRVTKELVKKETGVKSALLPSGPPPRIVQVHPSFQVVRRGGSAHIVCLAAGDPPLEIQWRADGRELGAGTIASGGFLQLRGVQPSDGGKYICTARNSAGSAQSGASIVVT